MRNFKYVRGGKNAKTKPRTRKQAIEMGDVAPVLLENFATLTGFKPRLDLLEADNHNPPQMSGLPGDIVDISSDSMKAHGLFKSLIGFTSTSNSYSGWFGSGFDSGFLGSDLPPREATHLRDYDTLKEVFRQGYDIGVKVREHFDSKKVEVKEMEMV